MPAKKRIPSVPDPSYFAMERWFSKMYSAGFLYHPDDPAEIIVSIDTGAPTFTPEECAELNQAVALMFEHHGDKVYKVGLKYMYKALGFKPDYSEA